MELTWLGHSCFRIRGKDATVLTDPCPKETGYNIGPQTANIVTISHQHHPHNYTAVATGSHRVIDGPGEYEVGGISIVGVRTYHDAQGGSELGKNTAYMIEIDGVRVCHLGDIGHVPTQEQIEELSGADILLVPVGGHTTIDGVAAARTVSLLEPRMIVPMHYATPATSDAELEGLERFLKELGIKEAVPEAKITVNRGGLPSEPKTVVLSYKS